MEVLITGGAGFIGSHVADELIERGHTVRVLDCLSPQIHGQDSTRPDYLHDDVELIIGDLQDRDLIEKALDGVDAVFHLAAAVGVGQSMYRIAEYTSVNNLGTALLLEALAGRRLQRLVVASSMSIYGEGAYCRSDGSPAEGIPRTVQQMRSGQWELVDDQGEVLQPIPTPESKMPDPSSVYALSKYDQERLCLVVGKAYGIPTVALRFFNVYGPRQALSNPYTGVLAIFAARYLNNRPPVIFEDGYQRRDFVSVHDVAQACRLALESPDAVDQVFNVGSGRSLTVREIADQLGQILGVPHIEAEVTHQYRVGDVRHCFADITKARNLLGYEPRVTLQEGLQELAGWLDGKVALDRADQMRSELAERGLTV